jgi:uncharacterized membrane protein
MLKNTIIVNLLLSFIGGFLDNLYIPLFIKSLWKNKDLLKLFLLYVLVLILVLGSVGFLIGLYFSEEEQFDKLSLNNYIGLCFL